MRQTPPVRTESGAGVVSARQAWVALLVVVAAVVSSEDWGVAGALAAAAAAAGVALAWTERAPPAVLAAALATAGAACVHFAVVLEHLREWWGFGAFFLVCGWAQLVWAALAPRRRDTRLLWVGLAGNLLVLALWLVSRTVGLPFGPEPGEVEPVGAPDAVASALEAVAAVGCALALVRGGRPAGRERWLLAAAALAATAYGIAAVGGGHA